MMKKLEKLTKEELKMMNQYILGSKGVKKPKQQPKNSFRLPRQNQIHSDDKDELAEIDVTEGTTIA